MFGPRLNLKDSLRHFAHPYLNFTVGQKVRNFAPILTLSCLQRTWFHNAAKYRKSKTLTWSNND